MALYIAPANGCAGRCRWASLGGIVFSSPGWAACLRHRGSAILALTRLVGRSFSVPTSVLPSKVSAVICLCRYFTPSRAWVFYISAVANFSHGSGRWMAGRQTLPCAISVNPVQPPFRIFFLFGAPTVILRQYQDLTGPAITPPEWCFGPWMSSNRWECADQVEEQLAQMEQHQIPATVLVLERWSDDTIFDRFEDASHHVEPGSHCFCDEELDFTHNRRWPSPRRLCQKIQEHGLKLILWQAPILRLPPDGQYPQAEQDIAYAIKKSLLRNDAFRPAVPLRGGLVQKAASCWISPIRKLWLGGKPSMRI